MDGQVQLIHVVARVLFSLVPLSTSQYCDKMINHQKICFELNFNVYGMYFFFVKFEVLIKITKKVMSGFIIIY